MCCDPRGWQTRTHLQQYTNDAPEEADLKAGSQLRPKYVGETVIVAKCWFQQGYFVWNLFAGLCAHWVEQLFL